ncbi:hypothetical protein [Stutzerimonas stutzeri]|uniref:Uncharacterized protein n=1 Tax=Stutzerimonas stutzeri TaxID=316 RepID=A0A2N8RH71_STUST|nr:hypothetical protein [Stutzerimonas stutzeri]MCQ4253353.1 hypothetical protein [Stutzerimonas stutzeri]PNF60438.1 hypothetical protein CXK99_06980 [Stutzerimonas stutzeri]
MSKLYKFRPVLSADEACDLISRRTGETATLETIDYLVGSGYLTRIFCYGEIIVGFTEDAMEAMLKGQPGDVAVESLIGIVSQYYALADQFELCQAVDTAASTYYFFRVKPDDDGTTHFKDQYLLNDLLPIAREDKDAVGFLYEELASIIETANDEARIPEPPKFQPLLIRVEKPVSPSRRGSVSELLGFETAGGVYSPTPRAKEALTQQATMPSKLDYRERESMERIILALARTAGFDLTEPFKAATALQAAAAREGVELPKSKDNIAGKLKAAARHDCYN